MSITEKNFSFYYLLFSPLFPLFTIFSCISVIRSRLLPLMDAPVPVSQDVAAGFVQVAKGAKGLSEEHVKLQGLWTDKPSEIAKIAETIMFDFIHILAYAHF